MKPFTLLALKYPRTILADVDAIFLRSPDDLFNQHTGLSETGALFYHDRAIGSDDGMER